MRLRVRLEPTPRRSRPLAGWPRESERRRVSKARPATARAPTLPERNRAARSNTKRLRSFRSSRARPHPIPGITVLCALTSAADLKFLQRLGQIRSGRPNEKRHWNHMLGGSSLASKVRTGECAAMYHEL